MSKAPSFQFYPADWQRDLSEHPLEIEGAWIRICCALWWSDTPGQSTKHLTNWSRILREKEKKTFQIINYLFNQKIANVVIQNESITISSRRMLKDVYISKIRKESGAKGGNPIFKEGAKNPYYLDKQSDDLKDKQKITPSSSSSTSILSNREHSIECSLSETEKIVSDGNGKYPPCPQNEIVNLYHKELPELPRVKHWPENLQVILRTRWKEDPVRQNLEWWEQFYRYVHESDFLMGRTKEAFVADLEWLIRPKNFTKIANGRYHGRGNLSAKPQPGIAAWLAGRRENATA